MTDTKYNIRYYGELIPGSDSEKVAKALAITFNVSEEKAKKLIGSSNALLQKNVDLETAELYQKKLFEAGLKTYVTEAESLKQVDQKRTEPAYGLQSSIPEPEHSSADGSKANKSSSYPSSLPFEFDGRGSEYFRIWIVNLILSIVTLGIYSAWAKVRKKRYFYSSTRVHGASFEYLAEPIKIFKGRMIVVGFFVLQGFASQFIPPAGFLFNLVLIIALPWIIVRSLAFNARYSSLRNIRFRFKAKIWDAAKAFMLWPLAGMLTLGLLAPYAFYKQKRFVVEHSNYGTSPFSFNATPRDYYYIFLFILLAIAIGVLVTVLAGKIFSPLSVLAILALYLYVFAYFSVRTFNLLFNTSKLDNHNFEATMDIKEYAFIIFTNTLGTVLTLGLFHPWAKVRALKYKVENLKFIPKGDPDEFVAAEQKQVSALGEEFSDFMDFDFGL